MQKAIIATVATLSVITGLLTGQVLRAAEVPDTTRKAAGATIEERTDSVAELQEFVVTAQKKLVESDGAKLTYNVEEDEQAQTSPVMDILRKVPGVSVDAEDNIKVNGQSSFKIFLNGREDPTLQGDVKNILKSMPASTIKKIEVISDPGAKYEAEGVGGILNIVTLQRQTLAGFMSNINLWCGNLGGGGSVSARTKVKNVTADIQVSYNNGKMFHKYTTTSQTYDDLTVTQEGENYRRQADQRKRINDYDYTGIRINTSWEPDTLNLFTLSGNLSFNNYGNRFDETTTGYDITGTKLWSYRRDAPKAEGDYRGGSVMASYQHTFGAAGAHNIVLSYSYSNNGNISDFLMHSYDDWNYPLDYTYSRSYYKGFSDTHIAQIDYSNPLRNWLTLEAGGKGSWYRNHQHSQASYGGSDMVLHPDMESDMRVNQFRDIWAAYVSADLSFNRLKGRAGVRYERTHMGLRYPVKQEMDYTSDLNDIVPNASATYSLTDASNFRLAYQMRISRPSLGVLNPYRNTVTEGQVYYGNPDIKSEKMHNIYLSYSNYDHPLSGTAKITYSRETNMVTDLIFMKDGLLNCTYGNIGRWQSVELELNLSWQPLQTLNINFFNGNSRVWMKADSELLKASKNYWQSYFNLSADYRFPCKLRLSGWGGFNTPWQDFQSKGESYYYYGIGISRGFLKDEALQLSLNANNIFPTHRKNTYTQQSETVMQTTSFRYPQWYIGVGVTFRFGGLTAQVKKTAASIESEAEASGGSKGK